MALLRRYAEGFNASETLRYFNATLSFPSEELVRATIDPILDSQRGGLGSEAVNGAILAGMFDLVIGCAAALVQPTKRAATMQLSMNFERAVRGDRLVAEAWVDRATRSVLFASAHIKDERGQVCAHAQGLVHLSDKPWKDGGSPAVN